MGWGMFILAMENHIAEFWGIIPTPRDVKSVQSFSESFAEMSGFSIADASTILTVDMPAQSKYNEEKEQISPSGVARV